MDVLQDVITGPPSPSKGKGSDTNNKTWRAGWWDFYPLLERPKRPLQWSHSSVIFTAHPTQALITGCHFSTSRQFVLPSPAPIITSPTFYDPPSFISVSPGDRWLFAYFPRRDGDGVGCLWKRGSQIDKWLVNECWNYPKCRGVVTATWLGGHREWVLDAQGSPTRLPTRGPPTPVSDPTLLVVTEDNSIHLTYVRHYQSGIKFLKRHLSIGGFSAEMMATVDAPDSISHTRRCIDAAIGSGYSDTSVYVATHSSRIPPSMRQVNTVPPYSPMDLSVPVGSTAPDQRTMEWELWGDEHVIELFEVIVRFDGTNIALSSNLIYTQECPLPLVDMVFSCSPPTSSPPVDPISTPKRNTGEKGKVMLVMSTADFHDYNEPPTSTLDAYSITSRIVPNNPRNIWSVQKESSWKTETGVISYIQPFLDLSKPNVMSMYVCILDTSGPMPTGEKEATIGTIKVLTLTDFSEDRNWESSLIKCPTARLGGELPLISTLSPNRRLFCTIPFSLAKSRTTIHTFPQRKSFHLSIPIVSNELAIAILGRVTTSDIVHSICSPQLSRDEATNTIYHTLSILDKHFKSQIPYSLTWDVIGVAAEVYRERSLYAKEEGEIKLLKDLWLTAHDMCSLGACNVAFEDCQEKDGYDLDSAWQIISVCTWVVNFTERLMKACVLSSNSPSIDDKGVDTLHVTDSDVINLPILLHLSHPSALQNLITALKHVKAIRTFLGTLPAGGEHAKAAQSILIDAVDCSGINFSDLLSLLEDNFESTQKLEPLEYRKALAACQPTPIMRPQVVQLLQGISQSKTILNKSTLFIKASDLVDAVARLSISNQRKNEEQDVVTKSLLDKQGSKGMCLRCGGRTSVGPQDFFAPSHQSNPRWTAWELMWHLRCICGGSWFSVVRS